MVWVSYLGHSDPSHSLVLVDMLDYALMHEQDMGPTRYVWVDGHWEYELI